MSVFNLQEVKKDSKTANTGESLNADELQSTTSGQTSPEASNTGALLGEDSEKMKSVRLDGPLSSIYAQALNVAFAKESMADGSMLQLTETDNANEEGVNPDLYIYTTDEQTLNSQGVGREFDHLRIALDKLQNPADSAIVVLENPLSLTKRLAIEAFEEYALSRHSKLMYSREHALPYIQAKLKTLVNKT